MVVKDGRYGPYVTDGETNASLRSRDGDTVEGLTAERAADLLQARRDAGPAPRRARKTAAKKAPAKKAAARKAPAKKAAATKAPARKAAAKKSKKSSS
jgi:DNA topoisomerase-1